MATKALVEDWYDAHAEAEEHRLDDARLEFEVTKRVISDCIISLGIKEANIIDIGGGPGRYAISLAQQGHHVTLIDISAKSLAIAEANARNADISLEAIIHANALDITRHAASSSFDVVLCLGPLYHLTTREERACVVTNALAMAKPGAYVVLAYVTVFGHLRDMARRDSSRLVNEWGFYEKYLRTGVYGRRPDNESFHVYPRDVEGELESVKSEAAVVKMVSCEGFLGYETGRALAKVGDEDMERWVDVVMRSADHPYTFNSAEHLLVVLKKS